MAKLNWEIIRDLIKSEVSFNPPIVLDTPIESEEENLAIFNLNNSLFATSNIGVIYLPEVILDEDDFYTIEDVIQDLSI